MAQSHNFVPWSPDWHFPVPNISKFCSSLCHQSCHHACYKHQGVISTYRMWSNTSRGYYAKFEIEGGLLLLLKSSLIAIAEFCSCDFNWEQREVINGQPHLSYDVTCYNIGRPLSDRFVIDAFYLIPDYNRSNTVQYMPGSFWDRHFTIRVFMLSTLPHNEYASGLLWQGICRGSVKKDVCQAYTKKIIWELYSILALNRFLGVISIKTTCTLHTWRIHQHLFP